MSFIVYLILCRNLTRRIVSALPSPYGDSLKAGNFEPSLIFFVVGFRILELSWLFDAGEVLLPGELMCVWDLSCVWCFSGLSSNVSGNKDPRNIAPRSSQFYPPSLDYVFTILAVYVSLDWLLKLLLLMSIEKLSLFSVFNWVCFVRVAMSRSGVIVAKKGNPPVMPSVMTPGGPLDLSSVLFRNRIIFIGQPINAQVAQRVISQLVTLASIDDKSDILVSSINLHLVPPAFL